ncbi:hypothetical protein F889_01535 [Acinetobacter colistiniresistens]|uniref:Uncharacterized protein n=1 Tax=Acinetobacter colistiniresistens TaxID=280145 RepID=N9R8D5_9GAMM|nr:hypothetical protein [Acinetobacter colistiniresistens]ENX34895.1 hypothetical protein F889_01535 [Acinetobacter colistiniresistens]
MKFTFNFDLAILITLLTSFLFWCGYWYNYGYGEFFGVTISFSDLSIPNTMIDGFLVGLDKFFYLFLFLLIAFFISNNSGKDGFFIFSIIVTSTIWLSRFIYHFCFGQFKKSKYVYIQSYYQSPFLKKYFPQPPRRTTDLTRNRSLAYAKNYLVKNRFDYSYIKKSIYGEGETGIIKKLGFMYFALLIFISIILILFNSGMNLQIQGNKDAKNNFELSFKKREPEKNEIFRTFPKIKELKNQNLSNNYRLTNLCNKDSCFAVKQDKTTRLVKLESIEILNEDSKPKIIAKET